VHRGGDHGTAASFGVEEGTVEQLFSQSIIAVLFCDREEGEHPYALAYERQRHAGHPVVVHCYPGASGVVLQEVEVAFLAARDLFGAIRLITCCRSSAVAGMASLFVRKTPSASAAVMERNRIPSFMIAC